MVYAVSRRSYQQQHQKRLSKEERRQNARKHTQLMQKFYQKQIEDSVQSSVIYAGLQADYVPRPAQPTEFSVTKLDSVSAIFRYAAKDKKTAVLNFASWKYAGGGFMNGSMAQEEALCQESDLYNVLDCFNATFYEPNRKQTHGGLYADKGIYSPGIVFLKNSQEKICDVLTVAAPNRNAAVINGTISEEENEQALKQRCEFVVQIADKNAIDTLILGAFGCGVFAQDPYKVAGIFQDLLTTTYKGFTSVIFAVVAGSNPNYQAFVDTFAT